MPLTTAGLAGVEPGDAGAASGLVNVTQQLGAALGLAVLVTVLSAAAGHAQLKAGAAVPTDMVHGLDLTFGVAALFGIAALVMVALLVHLPARRRRRDAGRDRTSASRRERESAGAEFELVDGEGFEWPNPGARGLGRATVRCEATLHARTALHGADPSGSGPGAGPSGLRLRLLGTSAGRRPGRRRDDLPELSTNSFIVPGTIAPAGASRSIDLGGQERTVGVHRRRIRADPRPVAPDARR